MCGAGCGTGVWEASDWVPDLDYAVCVAAVVMAEEVEDCGFGYLGESAGCGDGSCWDVEEWCEYGAVF